LSTSIEALIACMTALGLAANRPPHISWPLALGGLDLDSDMSETTAEPPKKPHRALLWPALALIGLAVLVYVVFLVVSKPGPSDLKSLAGPGLEKLEVLAKPPAQPTTRFVDAAGATHTLADWRGKVVLVNLWATWCAPCVKEMPTLAALSERVKRDGVAVVAISMDKEDRAFAARRLAQLSSGKLAFYNEPSYAIAFDAQAPGFPTTIIYSRDGHELARVSGEADWSKPQARRLVEAALNAK
jgi:thiol-disulfide isomerase/thioredoxin